MDTTTTATIIIITTTQHNYGQTMEHLLYLQPILYIQ